MSFASNTPVQFLPGIGVRTAQVLHDLDIHTAGQLQRMPEKVLIELFGPSIRVVTNNLSIAQKKKPAVTPALPQATTKKTLFQRLRIAANVMTLL